MRHPSPCNTTERRPIKTGPVRGGGRRTIYWTSVDFLKKNVKSRYMVVVHLDFVDSDLGSSPGWWAVTAVTYCPTGGWNIPNLSQPNPGA